jgi:hypothetical protein
MKTAIFTQRREDAKSSLDSFAPSRLCVRPFEEFVAEGKGFYIPN